VRRIAAVLLLSLAVPRAGSAQLPLLEGLFKKVTDVNLFGLVGWFDNRPSALAGRIDDGEPRSGGLTGLGFEVSFEVLEFSPRDTLKAKVPERTIDTIQVERVQDDGTRIIYKPVAPDPPDPDNRWMLELALGYTEIQDFVSAQPGLDLRGSVREFPSASLYLNHLPRGKDEDSSFGYYLGVRTGLAHLHGFRGFVGDFTSGPSDTLYLGGGTTFQFGVVLGAVLDFGPFSAFVEPGYTRRRFAVVEWSAIGGTISDLLPRSLDISMFALSFGAQLPIGAAAN
jgi:hypothetical protein